MGFLAFLVWRRASRGRGAIRFRQSFLGVFVLAGVVLSAAVGVCAQTVIYVDRDASGPEHDGTSWCRAYLDLQHALEAAVGATEIRVAAGTYKPTDQVRRGETFQLASEVALRGGYAGCGAADPDERDLAVNETILSGDLLGDDDPTPASSCCTAHGGTGCEAPACEAAVCAERQSCCHGTWDGTCATWARILCCDTCGNMCDNSYHVVRGWGTDASAILEGFTITGGFANGSNPDDRGAGLYNYFIESSPTIINCTFRGHVAVGKGAGIYNDQSTATFTNCAIVGNTAPTGAGMYNIQSSPTLVNCTISANMGTVHSAGIWNVVDENDYPRLANCILWANVYAGGMNEFAQMNVSNDNLIIDYTCIQGWTGTPGEAGNTGADPLLADVYGADTVPGTGDEDLRLTAGSSAINTGDPAFVPDAGVTDLGGGPRLQGCRVDRGAYETSFIQLEGDFDADGVLTLADYSRFQQCMAPAENNPDWCDACLCVFDYDGDDDVGLGDFAAFHAAFIAP